MNKKYTPGPWLRDRETVYALMHGGWRKGIEQLKNRFYAHVYIDHECSEEEREANAKLISAVPDLLEALQNLAHIIDQHQGSSAHIFAAKQLENARFAIKKALGE